MKAVSFLLPILFFIGCLNNHSEEGYEFGSNYNMVTTSEVPSIQNDSLIIKVSYGGCNGNHSFLLKNQTFNAGVELWLFKQTPDQPCDMLIRERKSFKLKKGILEAKSIILIKPDENRINLK